MSNLIRFSRIRTHLLPGAGLKLTTPSAFPSTLEKLYSWDQVSRGDGSRHAAFASDKPVYTRRLGLHWAGLEPGADNQVARSNEFSHADWTKAADMSVTSAPADMPFEGAAAWNLIEGTANQAHLLSRTLAAFSAAHVKVVVYATLKASTRTRAYLQLTGNDGTVHRAWFNLANGTAGTATAGVEETWVLPWDSAGAYLVAMRIVAGSGATTPVVGVAPATADNSTSYDGDGASALQIWNIDVIEGYYPLTPVVTGASPAWRTAGILSAPASLPASGHLFMVVDLVNDPSQVSYLFARDADNYLRIEFDRSLTLRLAAADHVTAALNWGDTDQFTQWAILVSWAAGGKAKIWRAPLGGSVTKVLDVNLGANPTAGSARFGSSYASAANVPVRFAQILTVDSTEVLADADATTLITQLVDALT